MKLENVIEACIKKIQDAGGVLRDKRDGRRSRRGDDRGGEIDGEHGVGCPRRMISGQMTMSTIGRLSGGAHLRILRAEGEVGH